MKGVFLLTEWILTSVLVLLLLFQLLLWHKKRKKLAGFCFNAFTGLLTLFPVSFLITQAGLSLPVNFLTGAASAILGAPGVALLSGAVFAASCFRT